MTEPYVQLVTPTSRTQPQRAQPIVQPVVRTKVEINGTQYEALDPYKDTYWIEPNDITRIRMIQSDVMKLEVGNCNGQAVVIRSLKNPQDPAFQRQIIAETLSLTRLSHPNIVKFLGFNVTDDIGLQCISEYVDNKTLRDLLNNPKRAAKLTWANEKINIAIGVASALAYMHGLQPALIHRNIKASTVLLTKSLVPKLSGFEKSRDRTLLDDMTSGVGDVRWSAPELLLDEEMYDEKIDVYSFGVMLTELDTCELPFAKEEATMRANELQGKLMTGSLLPKCSNDCPKSILRIFKMCIQHDPSLRPTSRKLLELLQQAKKELQ